MSLSHWVGKQFKIALRLVLWPLCLRNICFSFTYILCCVCFPVASILFWWWYITSFIATAANPGSFAYFLVYLRFAFFPFLLLFRPWSFRSLSCSSWVISDHCRNPPHVVSPNNRFYTRMSCRYNFHWSRWNYCSIIGLLRVWFRSFNCRPWAWRILSKLYLV